MLPLLLSFLVAASLAAAHPAAAQRLRGRTVAPNWALGNPQPVFIRGCSDVDALGIPCLGAFGAGPLSDVLRVLFLGGRGNEVALREGARLNVGPFLYAGNENQGDWWDLWIPTARWVGFGPNAGILWRLRDVGDANFFGDAIAYVNIANAAHILWASNNSPDPSNIFPPDFDALLATLTLTQNTADVRPDGTFDETLAPPPQPMDCTTDPACTPTGDYLGIAAVPEPSTLALCGAGLFGVSVAARRRRRAG